MHPRSAYAALGLTSERKSAPDEEEKYFRLYEINPGPNETKIKEVIPGR